MIVYISDTLRSIATFYLKVVAYILFYHTIINTFIQELTGVSLECNGIIGCPA